MPRPGRTWLPLTTDYFDDPLVAELSPLAQNLDIGAMMLAYRLRTEGSLRRRQMEGLALVIALRGGTDDAAGLVGELTAVGLWLADDGDEKRLARRSWDSWHPESESRTYAAHVRWHERAGRPKPGCPFCDRGVVQPQAVESTCNADAMHVDCEGSADAVHRHADTDQDQDQDQDQDAVPSLSDNSRGTPDPRVALAEASAQEVVPITRRRRKADPPSGELFEALADACSIELPSLTSSLRGAMNRAVSDLRKVGATAEEVAVRADRYRRAMPQARLTPTALAKHWAMLGEVSTRASGPNRNVSSFEGMETGVVWDA